LWCASKAHFLAPGDNNFEFFKPPLAPNHLNFRLLPRRETVLDILSPKAGKAWLLALTLAKSAVQVVNDIAHDSARDLQHTKENGA
jgi:hypothetical protein